MNRPTRPAGCFRRGIPRPATAAFAALGSLTAALVLLAGLAAAAAETSARYLVDSWGTDAGLPQNSVPAIAQTPDGFLWAGTFNGLVRFDGHQFRTFAATETPGLASDNINVLRTDAGGRLWIGTDDAGVSLYDGRQFVSYRATNSVGALRIVDLAIRPDGTGWVGTADGLLEFEHGSFSVPPPEAGFTNAGRIHSMLADPEGRIWIGGSEGLFRVDGDQLRRDPHVVGPAWIHRGLGGTSLAHSAASGVWRITGDTWTNIPDTLGAEWEVVAETRPGELWGLPFGPGLHRHANGRRTPWSENHGIASEQMSTIFADAEGNLWAGSNGGGLHRLHRQALLNLTTTHGLPSDDVVCLLEDRPGRVWAGMYGGGTTVWEGNAFAAPAGLPGRGSTTYALALDRDRSLWLGSIDGTLWHWREGSPPESRTTEGEGSRVILRTRSGDLWLGSKYAGVTRERAGAVTRFTTTNGLAHGYVTALAEAPDGAVWVGTKRGLHHIEGDRVTRYSRADGLGADAVHTLFQDDRGILWIGTAGGGLTRWKDGAFRTLTTAHGLPDNVVSQILDDGVGQVWIGSNRGLFRVRRDLLDAVADGSAPRLLGLRLGRGEGMANPECAGSFQPSCLRASDGRLWFATVGGIVIVNPADLPAPAAPPPVHLLAVTADGVEISSRTDALGLAPARFVIPPGTARLEFAFTAVNFATPDQTRFLFRLHDVDSTWVPANESRSATYTSLAPGDYRFEVTAANPEGDWNPQAAIVALHVQPFWWQTFAFRLSAAVSSAAVLALATRVVHRRYLQRKLDLARRQEEQKHARALAETNRTLAARSRELEEALANVKVLSGLIPICASCKKIRDDRGFWSQVEKYLQQRTDARFTHGLCPECLEKLYHDIDQLPPLPPKSSAD